MSRAEALAPRLLHNMSCPPATRVDAYRAAIGPLIVRFDLALAAPCLAADAGARELGAEHLETADRMWQGELFTGAAMVFPWVEDALAPPPGLARPEVRVATDEHAVLNVVGRSRGALLLPRWPLSTEPEHLLRSLATQDERLVALAERTGWR